MNMEQIDQEEVDARVKFVLNKYGAMIDPSVFGEIRRWIQSIVVASEELKAVKLENDMGPGVSTVPYRKD